MDNDTKLLEKVLSKADIDYSIDCEIIIAQANGQEEIPDWLSYKKGYLAGIKKMEQEARASERAKLQAEGKALKCVFHEGNVNSYCDRCMLEGQKKVFSEGFAKGEKVQRANIVEMLEKIDFDKEQYQHEALHFTEKASLDEIVYIFDFTKKKLIQKIGSYNTPKEMK